MSCSHLVQALLCLSAVAAGTSALAEPATVPVVPVDSLVPTLDLEIVETCPIVAPPRQPPPTVYFLHNQMFPDEGTDFSAPPHAGRRPPAACLRPDEVAEAVSTRGAGAPSPEERRLLDDFRRASHRWLDRVEGEILGQLDMLDTRDGRVAVGFEGHASDRQVVEGTNLALSELRAQVVACMVRQRLRRHGSGVAGRVDYHVLGRGADEEAPDPDQTPADAAAGRLFELRERAARRVEIAVMPGGLAGSIPWRRLSPGACGWLLGASPRRVAKDAQSIARVTAPPFTCAVRRGAVPEGTVPADGSLLAHYPIGPMRTAAPTPPVFEAEVAEARARRRRVRVRADLGLAAPLADGMRCLGDGNPDSASDAEGWSGHDLAPTAAGPRPRLVAHWRLDAAGRLQWRGSGEAAPDPAEQVARAWPALALYLARDPAMRLVVAGGGQRLAEGQGTAAQAEALDAVARACEARAPGRVVRFAPDVHAPFPGMPAAARSGVVVVAPVRLEPADALPGVDERPAGEAASDAAAEAPTLTAHPPFLASALPPEGGVRWLPVLDPAEQPADAPLAVARRAARALASGAPIETSARPLDAIHLKGPAAPPAAEGWRLRMVEEVRDFARALDERFDDPIWLVAAEAQGPEAAAVVVMAWLAPVASLTGAIEGVCADAWPEAMRASAPEASVGVFRALFDAPLPTHASRDGLELCILGPGGACYDAEVGAGRARVRVAGVDPQAVRAVWRTRRQAVRGGGEGAHQEIRHRVIAIWEGEGAPGAVAMQPIHERGDASPAPAAVPRSPDRREADIYWTRPWSSETALPLGGVLPEPWPSSGLEGWSMSTGDEAAPSPGAQWLDAPAGVVRSRVGLPRDDSSARLLARRIRGAQARDGDLHLLMQCLAPQAATGAEMQAALRGAGRVAVKCFDAPEQGIDTMRGAGVIETVRGLYCVEPLPAAAATAGSATGARPVAARRP